MFSQDIIDRFWRKVDKTSDPDGHWLWTASRNLGGYGNFHYPTPEGKWRIITAHRFAYVLLHPEIDAIPKDLFVLHKPPCVVRHCVLHTYLGTQKQNWADTLSLGREASGEKNGWYLHPESVRRGEKNGNTKLTEAEVKLIRDLGATKTLAEIAQLFDISMSAVSAIQTGKLWNHIPDNIRKAVPDGRGSNNGNSRLTTAQILDIRACCIGRRGEQMALAKEYGVSRSTITNIVRRYQWKHI